MKRPRSAVLAALLLALGAAASHAHPLAPSLLDLREEGGGVRVLWKTPLLTAPGVLLQPELPDGCTPLAEAEASGDATSAMLRWTLDCGDAGLLGRRVGVRGLDRSRTEALLRVEFADGRRVSALLRADEPTFVVPGRTSRTRVAADYAELGFRHILSGPDHLLFVLGLVLLVTGGRALLWTVTAFTLGHSLTLSLAVLGFVRFPTGLIEFGIAGSILVLAVELARPPGAAASRLGRRPALMAAAFGLLHGLGFAGALTDAGLPADEIPVALFSFNVGIELGQLAFVLCVVLARPLLRRLAARGPGWVARLPAYAIGSLAAFWCFDRAAALIG